MICPEGYKGRSGLQFKQREEEPSNLISPSSQQPPSHHLWSCSVFLASHLCSCFVLCFLLFSSSFFFWGGVPIGLEKVGLPRETHKQQ